MKTGWVTKRLGEVCEEIRDRIPSSKIVARQYIGTENMLKECVGIVDAVSVPNDVGLVHYQTSDILLSNIRPYLKKIWLADREGGCSSDVIVFRPSSCIDSGYLTRLLSQDSFFDYSMLKVGGTKMPRGDRNWIKDFKVARPESLAEQKRIVAKIDAAFEKIDKLKANAERNLANAKELFQSALNEAMRPKPGWVEKRLGEVCTEFGRGKSKHRPRNDKRLYGGPYPFVQTGDVRNADHNIDKFSQTYSELGLSQSKLWPKGTLCITIAANIAETAILGFDACFPDSVIGCVFDEGQMHTGFAEYMLQNYKSQLQSFGKDRSSSQPNINLGTFEDNAFPIPPLVKQKQIVKQLDSLSDKVKSLEQNYTRLIADCAEMRQAVLKEAFEGRL